MPLPPRKVVIIFGSTGFPLLATWTSTAYSSGRVWTTPGVKVGTIILVGAGVTCGVGTVNGTVGVTVAGVCAGAWATPCSEQQDEKGK